MSREIHRHLKPSDWLAILACAALATILSLFFRGYELRFAVPVMFLLVIITLAQLLNRLATILIAGLACMIFALVLFEPYGSLAIQNAADRLALSVFALSAFAAISLSPQPVRQKVPRTWLRK